MSTTSSPHRPTSAAAVAALLDHAILHPTVTPAQMLAEVDRTAAMGLASLCVRPGDVVGAVERSAGRVPVGTVIGFPHGTTSTAAKVAESERALRDGAAELDMVVHVGAVLGEDWDRVRDDVAAVLDSARGGGALLKVIFETDYVTEDAHKTRLCEICCELRADYVKTSTGFGYVKNPDGTASYTGATEHDVRLMLRVCAGEAGVKPSGGVRTLDDALRFAAMGATRLGTGSAPGILAEARERFGGSAGAGSGGAAGSSNGY